MRLRLLLTATCIVMLGPTGSAQADPAPASPPNASGLSESGLLESDIFVASELRPDLSGVYPDMLTGRSLDLADRDDTLLLIDVWATWCPPCIQEIPVLRTLAAKHAGRLQLVSVNADAVTGGRSADEVRAFMDRHGIDYPVLYDNPARSLAQRLVVRGYPAKFLVTADGTLLVSPGSRYPMVNLGDVDAYLSGLE